MAATSRMTAPGSPCVVPARSASGRFCGAICRYWLARELVLIPEHVRRLAVHRSNRQDWRHVLNAAWSSHHLHG